MIMTAEEIIARLRKEIDRMYEDYEGTRMIEEEDAMEGFEDIINDYYEDKSHNVTMDKKEAIKILRELHDKVLFSERTALETLHPELKESEDERIRKSLTILLQHFCKGYRVPGLDFPVSYKDMLTWLEKQGEHKKFRDSILVGDEVTRNRDGVIVNLSQLKRVAKPAQQKLPIEKLPEEMKTIGESLGFTTQKECDEYNKMVSDLIMSGDNMEEQKSNVENKKLTDVNHEYFSELLENDNSEDINDYAYQVAYCMSHDWTIENPTWDNVQSACRLGAKWQKKHDVSEDWSEEDEKMIGRVRGIIEAYAFSQSAVDVNGDLCEKKFIDVDIWLKSIKYRYTWKPSDAQMRALEYIINNAHNTSYSCKIAKELLEQLRKLKGE